MLCRATGGTGTRRPTPWRSLRPRVGGGDDFRVHLTHRQGKEQLGEWLDAFLADKPAVRHVFRDDDTLSVKVDLATAVDY